jgi:protein SCO1
LGTLAAAGTKLYRSRQNSLPALLEKSSANDDDEETWVPTPPDPGKRAMLASLVESARNEDRWLKEFEFVDQTGEKVTSESLRGQPYVACFFYTTCKSSCPRQISQMQLLAKKLKNKPIRFVSITVDPEVDTPEVLAAYAQNIEANPAKWKFLHGPMDYTQRVGVEKFFLEGVVKRDHPDRFCLVNAQGDIIGSYYWMDVDERDLLEKHIAEILK